LDIKKLPVDENEVADFLGYEIKEIMAEEITEWPGIRRLFQVACAHLFKQENLILINREMARVRKRTCAFHECGHDIIPWHIGLNFACSESAIEPLLHRSIEREAFLCGAEIMMPHHLFIPDMLSVPLGLNAIDALAHRYETSFESTAIQYTKVSRALCAVVVVEPSEAHVPNVQPSDHKAQAQLTLPLNIPHMPMSFFDVRQYPLRVKYCAKSPRFPQYILPGRGIRDGNPIFEAWEAGMALQTEIPAALFDPSAIEIYNAEIRPLSSGQIIAFLWLPDQQYALGFNEKAIL
jgi:hypothetical protein